ncbi:MAG: DUF4870 domain-containing protein [candidate division WOR-3 bacterium]|jgi:uncharacterized membrane protein
MEETKINPIAILSYIGILCLIPLLVEKEDEFVKFHARQGLALFLCEVITFFISWFPFIGWIISFFAWILWFILSIIGIINVLTAKKAPLPIIGQLAERFKI